MPDHIALPDAQKARMHIQLRPLPTSSRQSFRTCIWCPSSVIAEPWFGGPGCIDF